MNLPRPARPAPPSRRAAALLAPGAALLTLVAGCASPGSEPTDAPQSAAESGTLPSAHVHGVAFAPEGGTFLLATHEGLIEVGDGGEVTPVGPVIDLMGFAVTDDRYLASGHPGPGVDLPQPVGLIESTDGGQTWTALSRQGQSDFHALTASSSGDVLGWDGSLVRSADGRTWEQLDIPAEPHTLAAAPDGSAVLATTQHGLLRSTDAGTTWSAVDGAPLLQVVDWAEDATTAAGVDPAGTVWTSTDAAGTWQQGARLGSVPDAVAVASGDGSLRIAVVTAEALLESDDGGQTFTVVLGH
jgi:photosystem II stability/assembly factor-like uncharacterized protein